jgi:exosortase
VTSARLKSLSFVGGWIAAGLLFAVPVKATIGLAATNEWYTHVLLAVPISIVLLSLELDPAPPQKNTKILSLVTALAVGAWWFTGGPGDLWGPMFALVAVWIGLFYGWNGARATRAAAFPLAFLLFAIPVPLSWMEAIVHFLQQNSARATEVLFKVLGVPAERHGFVFALPVLTIEVAEECSGIHSAIALFLASTVAAHLMLRTRWKQVCFALAAIPVAILKNAIRIVTISGLTVYVDPSVVDGPLHHQGGPVFAVVGLVLLAPILYILWRTEGRDGHKVPIPQRDISIFP